MSLSIFPFADDAGNWLKRANALDGVTYTEFD